MFDALVSEIFPDITFEWEDLTEEEKQERTRERKRQQQLEREKARREWKERERERKRRQKLEMIEKSLTPLDYEILELRKKGTSLWSICRKKGLTLNIVVHRLRKMSMVPKLLKDWPVEYQPLSREERRNLKH